jgi:hypothetical protein
METPMAEKQFFTPLSDFVFKLVFADRRNGVILKAFLSAALEIPEAELGELTLIDPHLKPEAETDKLCVLDVKVRTVSGMVINVEDERSTIYFGSVVIKRVSIWGASPLFIMARRASAGKR